MSSQNHLSVQRLQHPLPLLLRRHHRHWRRVAISQVVAAAAAALVVSAFVFCTVVVFADFAAPVGVFLCDVAVVAVAVVVVHYP